MQHVFRIAAIFLFLAVAFFCLAYPIYVIRPFRHQGPGELAVALAVIRIRPILTGLVSFAAAVWLAYYWRAQHRLRWRIASAAGVLGVFLCTALARVNVYEIMFHPMGRPSVETARESRLDGKEMVVAVDVGGLARAYPIRILSYHHIANDTVGGVPIAATY